MTPLGQCFWWRINGRRKPFLRFVYQWQEWMLLLNSLPLIWCRFCWFKNPLKTWPLPCRSVKILVCTTSNTFGWQKIFVQLSQGQSMLASAFDKQRKQASNILLGGVSLSALASAYWHRISQIMFGLLQYFVPTVHIFVCGSKFLTMSVSCLGRPRGYPCTRQTRKEPAAVRE